MKFKYITPFVREDFFTTVKRGIQDAANLLQADVEFTGTEGADCDELARLIDQAVIEGCAGLAVSVVDAEKLNPAIRRAREAGVPVVAFNIGAEAGSPVLANVCQDCYRAGVAVGKRASGKIPSGDKILITLHDDVAVLREREKGIREGLQRPAEELVTIVSGNSPELAADSIRAALKQNPDIRAVIGTGQSDTHGAGLVAGETKMYTAGFDVCGEILEMVKSGRIDFTIDQQPYVQGFYPLLQLYHYAMYGLMPSDIDAGNAIIDCGNVEKVIENSRKGYR